MHVESVGEYGGSRVEEVNKEDDVIEIEGGDYLAKVGTVEPVR